MLSSPDMSDAPLAAAPPRGYGRKFASLRSISALVLREMATRYGRSPGGYLWAVLEPLGAILILSFAFSLVLRSAPLGDSFILFFATAYLPFSLYQTLSNNVARSINFSRALLFYPAVSWIDAVLARFFLNALTEVLVMLIIFAGLIFTADTSPVLNVVPALIAISLTILLGLGIGVLNCALIGLFPVWIQIWSIATRPLFIISGVFFTYEGMPAVAQDILWYNPLMHISGMMRDGFYPTYNPAYISIPFVVFIGLICLFMGVILMRRYHRIILNEG